MVHVGDPMPVACSDHPGRARDMKQRPTATLKRKARRKADRARRKAILDRTAAARRERDAFIAGVVMGELDDFPVSMVATAAKAIEVVDAERPPIPPPVEIDPVVLQRVLREAARRTRQVERRAAPP